MNLALAVRPAAPSPAGAGPPPPFALLECRHPERTIYVQLGLFGGCMVRLCRRPPPGSPGWHGHGDIIAQRSTKDGIEALTLVVALAEAADPDALLAGHAA